MSDISEKEWKSALTSILEELDKSQYIKMLESLDKIHGSEKTARSKEKMPGKIIQYYGLEESISAINDAMNQIPRRDSAVQHLLHPFVDKLRNKHETENREKGKKRKRDPVEEETRPAAEVLTDLDPHQLKPLDEQKSCPPDKERNTRPWKSISDLKSSGQLLDTEAFTGKVVQKSELRTYQTKENVKKYFFYLAVADETDCVKMMVYGKKRHQEIKEESSYLFRKLIKDENGVKVTALSRVSETRPVVEVPEEIEKKAREVIHPESPVYSIGKAKSADQTEVSVEGKVSEIDPIEQVKVPHKQRKTKKQYFHLTDDTGSIRICMWGDTTKQCKGLSVGDVIKVTNMKTNRYFETVSLDSTGFTRIHKVQSVGIQNVRIEMKAITKATKRETHLEAEFNQQVHTFVVASRLLAKAFGLKLEGDFKGSLLGKMPLSADVEIQGNTIHKITVA